MANISLTNFSQIFATDPYAGYRALRMQGAVHWSEDFCGGAWVLTDYADVMAFLRDPRLRVQRAGGWVNSSGKEARAELLDLKRYLCRAMLFLDGASHVRLRNVMNPGFKQANIQAMRPRIQAIVDALIGQLIFRWQAGQDIDFMRDFARPLPAAVIAAMMGIEGDDRNDFVLWSDDIAEFIGSLAPTMEIARRAQAGVLAMNAYFDAALAERRKHLGDDLISLLLRAEQDGTIITGKELLAQCAMLLFAGHETTRNLLGNGLYALLRHPDQWQRLCTSPGLLPGAMRELLRYDSPVQYTGRRAGVDLIIQGQRIKKGDLVIGLIGAANRDPARFGNPEELQLDRDEGNHLSFGYGPHVCIGATLTYLEAEIALSALLRNFPDMTLHDLPPPQRLANSVYRGFSHLSVHLYKLSESSRLVASG